LHPPAVFNKIGIINKAVDVAAFGEWKRLHFVGINKI
jgi:hypothetical protein